MDPQRQPYPKVFTAYIIRVLTEIKMNASGVMKKITGIADGSAGTQDACTVKQMEDHVLAAIGDNVSKDPVHAGTTAALPANTRTADVLKADAVGAFPTIDGVAPVINQYYLVKNEGGGASHINNGIYELTVLGDGVTEWELTRRQDMEGGEGASGAMVPISDGTTNGDTTFKCINNIGSDTINTDALEFWFWGQTTDHANLKNKNWDVAGHVMNTALDMNSNQINEVTDPTLAQDVATKNYHDTETAFAKQPKVYIVDDGGNDTTGDGSWFKPLKTAQKALDLGLASLSVVEVFCSRDVVNQSITIPAGKTARITGNTFNGATRTLNVVTLGAGSKLITSHISIAQIDGGTNTATVIMEDGELGDIINHTNLTFEMYNVFVEEATLIKINAATAQSGSLWVNYGGTDTRLLGLDGLDANSMKVRSVATPTGLNDAATKQYVDQRSVPKETSFPGSPIDGDLVNRTDLDMVFRYDGGRTKWLSEHSEMFICGRGTVNPLVDVYCIVSGATMSSTNGVRMPRNGTIVAVTVQNLNSVTRTIDYRVNNSTSNRVQLALTATVGGKITNADQDFSADDLIQVLALVAAVNAMAEMIATVEVKWRA